MEIKWFVRVTEVPLMFLNHINLLHVHIIVINIIILSFHAYIIIIMVGEYHLCWQYLQSLEIRVLLLLIE